MLRYSPSIVRFASVWSISVPVRSQHAFIERVDKQTTTDAIQTLQGAVQKLAEIMCSTTSGTYIR